ncbi:HD domain-containing protein [Egicoccus halophilus]|uniref:HD domain-containing protein n=1 Tax=Egicoccus halophilus TaxID=1670830 RepID=A0A8J3EUE0_9ACTN|nr:HD domain-containing protein [Egicoccus halophilus]GGI06999.1 hypothetical protein GCM10011354_21900 [Egicoccus halophilus]
MSEIELHGRFAEAVRYAAEAHGAQVRKGTAVPYLSHPIAVAALVLEHGGNEVQATSAVLHDVVEDGGGRPRLDDVRARFGDEVADVVEALSDAVCEEGEPKAPWKPRKAAYLEHLRGLVAAGHPAALVSLCDKLHNASAIVADATEPHGPGADVWNRFSVSADQTAWYYAQLASIFSDRALPRRAVAGFRAKVDELTTAAEDACRAAE